MQAVLPGAFRSGFEQMFAMYGMPLSHMELRFVNGWGYISAFVHGAPRKGNGKAPPSIVLKLMTRVPPSARRRIRIAAAAIDDDLAMREIERWDRLRADWIQGNLDLQDVDLGGCSDAELADQLRRMVDRFRDGSTLHFALISQVMPVGEYLERCEGWGLDTEVAGKAAFHGVRSSIEGRARLAAIVAALDGDTVHDVDDIRSHSPEAARALDDYLRHHGDWVLSDDLIAPTLSELPGVVFQTIERHRAGGSDEQAEIAAAIELCRAAVPEGERSVFDSLCNRAQRAYAALDDNSGLLAAWPCGIARRAHIAAAERLVDRQALSSPEDVWVLEPDEIVGLLTGARQPSTDEIARRVHVREAQSRANPPAHLGSPPSPPPDASAFPAPVAQHVRHFLTFLSAKFGSDESAAFGIGDTPVTGRAIVATTPAEALNRVEPGDILITNATTPAFNVIMGILDGIVTTSGGPNSHTAVVARELGIAAVIGVRDALDRIPDGALVTVDPVAATVTLAG